MFSLFCRQLLRDGFDQTGRYRRLEAQGGHAERGRRHIRVQTAESDHVRLGDQGAPHHREHLRRREGAERELDQQVGC